MKPAIVKGSAEGEQPRIAAIKRYDILDTPPDGSFDRITAIAARRFNVPISIISIVDEDRIWFKSHHGLDINQIDREPGLCASAILSNEPHILLDAQVDPRSLVNPLVAGAFGLRFYAGVPLQTKDGHNLGTLCVIDKKPRIIAQDEIDDLKDLAAIVMDQLELRLSAREAVAQARLMAREIDHRVMNSLQFISGLLAMQSRQSDVAGAVDQLEAAANRVAAVARVACVKASGLTGAQVGPAIRYSDDLLIDARVVEGIYPQPHMKGSEARMLCLYNRKNKRVEVQELAEPTAKVAEVKDVWWRAEDIGGKTIVGGSEVTVMLGTGGKIGGKSGCDGYMARYHIIGNKIQVFPPMIGTRMACAPAIMVQEQAFQSLLEGAKSFDLTPDGWLVVSSLNGVKIALVKK